MPCTDLAVITMLLTTTIPAVGRTTPMETPPAQVADWTEVVWPPQSPSSATATGASLTDTDVTALRSAVAEFQDAWYRSRDQRRFWTFVHPDSPIRAGAFIELGVLVAGATAGGLSAAGGVSDGGRFVRFPSAFFGAFNGTPEPRTLDLTPVHESREDAPLPLNLKTNDTFSIYEGTPRNLLNLLFFAMNEETLEEMRRSRQLPAGQFAFVWYVVTGTGYCGEAMATIWTRDAAGQWKIFWFYGHD